MDKRIKVLLVDDREDYCESLAGVARQRNLQILYRLDWETGFELLNDDPEIEFIILDGKGKIEGDQETEKDNFVVRAMKDIDTWSAKKKNYIPYCVNTGFIDRFEALEGNVRIFKKNSEHRERMFDFIVEEVNKSHYRSMRAKFPQPFKAFDLGILDKKHEYILVELIFCYGMEDYKKKNINTQRDLLEGILTGLNNPVPCIPNSFFNNGRPNQEWCVRYLENRPTDDSNGQTHRLNINIPKDIKAVIRKLKESTNQYSHLSDETEVKLPFLANFYLLLEILCWLPNFVDKHYKNYI